MLPSFKTSLPPLLVPRFLGILERLARIAMFATRSPAARSLSLPQIFAARSLTSFTAASSLGTIHAPIRPSNPATPTSILVGARRLRRFPQASSCEPFHLSVWMLFADAMERGQQLFAPRGSESSR
jgi:hypothetical protein